MRTLDLEQKKELSEYLSNFVSDNKKSKINEIVLKRTRHLTVVLEDIFQSQNASAVLRTCDCFGIQDVHIIENRYLYELNPDVELGSAKWLSLNKYNSNEHNTLEAYENLRNNGYKIVATTPHTNDKLINDLNVDDKIALVFGTEREGLSEVAMENADAFVKIPMYGFTESFNISVSAAMSVFYLSEKIRNSNIKWQLKEEEIYELKINWFCNVIRMSDKILEDFFIKKAWKI
jgi:tRNA (guanosine-2'-O-)-methyltransferase